MKLVELGRGLWRWTAPHPDWEPSSKKDSPADWAEHVGSLAYDNGTVLVLVDPLVPQGDWRELDRLTRRRRVHVLTTIGFHRRSRPAVVERYGAETSRAKPNLPDGVESIPIKGAGETMFWIAEHRALVPGDRLLGGPLRMCPDSWLRYLSRGMTQKELRRELRNVLDLPIQMILTSHGDPVRRGGRAALERVLG